MAEKKLTNIKIFLRRDTTANWETGDKYLQPGEIGIEICSNNVYKAKIGPQSTDNPNGILWKDCPYLIADSTAESVESDISKLSSELDKLTAKVDTIETHDNGQDSTISDNATKISNLYGKMETAESKIADLGTTTDALETQYTALDDKVDRQVNSLKQSIEAVQQFEYEVATTLPEASANTMHKIYLVAHAHAEDGDVANETNGYDEYITVNSGSGYAWEVIGNTDIDLSNYAESSTVTEIDSRLTQAETDIDSLEGRVDGLVAGGGEPNVINKVDTTDFKVEDKTLSLSTATGSISDKVNNLQSAISEVKTAADNAATKDALEEVRGIANAAQKKADAADPNKIESIVLGDTAAVISGDKVVTIPKAGTNLGLVIASSGDNEVSVAEGIMKVNNITDEKLVSMNATKLTLDEGDYLVLDCGNA